MALDPKAPAPGQEQYERYYAHVLGGWRWQYNYRSPDGRLFSCVARTISDARNKRDTWLAKAAIKAK